MFARPAAGLEDTERGREAQSLLRNCVHCGFCLPACPTYRVTGNELDSPRGRIYLIKQLVEGAEASAITREHLDRCLTCRACERACPSGVEYGRLVDLGRELVDERVPRPATDRAMRAALVALFSRRRLFTALLRTGQSVQRWLPGRLRKRIPPRPSTLPLAVARTHTRRVVLLEGCVQPGLAPGINAAAVRVLDRLGIGVERVRGERCCGALGHHLGHSGQALEQARHNIDACCAALDAGAEAVVSTASACGLMVKDYGRLLAGDPRYADRAKRVSDATRDIAEIIRAEDLASAGLRRGTGPRVAWQAPCTLQHGQQLGGRVEPLLEAAGFALTATTGQTLCCGSAGTYSILQPELSGELRRRKLAALTGDAPQFIATANIGCLEHLRAAAAVPVRHWIELVAEALETVR
jgi:glycolate oxidase iron-sulfur subunit